MTHRSITPTHGFLLSAGLYFLLHLVIRVSFSDSLELDEAEQFLFSQWLDWGYSSQPPLYTWLQKILFNVLGHSVLALALMKNLCLFALYGLTFLLARKVLDDEKCGMLAALSLLLMPPIAWEASRDLTHTVLVACFVAGSALVVLQLLTRKTLSGYLMLGLVLGLGFLSKYNFTLHVAALLVSLATLPEGRRVLLDKRMVLTLVLAGVIYAPHGIWMIEHHAQLASGLEKLGQAKRHDLLPLWKLGLSIAAYITPMLIIAGLLLRVGLNRADFPPTTTASRLLGRYFLVLLGIVLIAIWFIDVDRMRTRWLFPFMVLFPVWLFTRIPVSYMTLLRSRIYLGLVGSSAIVILALMLLRVPGAAWTQKPTDLNRPFTELAEKLRQAGFDRGVIIAPNAHLAGNLHFQFPDSSLSLTPYLAFSIPDYYKSLPILVLWDAIKSPEMPERMRYFMRDRIGQNIDSLKPNYLIQAYRYSDTVESKIAYFVIGTERLEK